ncbi:MAG TPA: metallopeptidase TldD-related protein [Bryobacteraceae bacterium]|nr:metallopeptidase TldD-related protein [Bryobacteraceae bacterium]
MLRLAVLAALSVAAALAQTTPLLDILKQEMDRNFTLLKEKSDPAPYFISYSVSEQKTDFFAGTLGTLQSEGPNNNRIFDLSVRVGDRKLDNYHGTRGERPQFTTATLLPIDDVPDAIRRRVWLETDRVTRAATQRLINLRTSTQVRVEAEDTSDDFSKEEPSVYATAPKKFNVDAKTWQDAVRRWSGEFKSFPRVLSSGVSVRMFQETKYLVNTEGTRLQHGRTFARITIGASARAADGMDLSTSESFEAELPDGLPKDEQVRAAVKKVASDLTKLLDAPVVDAFVGPAILSGRASGVFFHEIFGHRIEGHRQKDESDQQTFTKMVNGRVLPEFLSVVFDPTKKTLAGTDLNGWYDYDDEGVKARPVRVVENGILKTFLMSRSPIKGFSQSNGHGRKQAGLEPVSRQSNLIVESSKQVSSQQLREMLIAEIKRQGKPHGFIFEHVTGGFTTTGRSGFQSFKVLPLVVYRIYADGRPDELVRGVDIVGTPLSSFARIMATSDKLEVFNGYCGAESGSVPVSAVSPAILVSELEIQKKEKGRDRPPLLPAPSISGGIQ